MKKKKKIYGKVFKAENVEDVDRRGAFALVDDTIDPVHKPSEQRAEKTKFVDSVDYGFVEKCDVGRNQTRVIPVKGLGYGISCVKCLIDVQRRVEFFIARLLSYFFGSFRISMDGHKKIEKRDIIVGE